MCSTRHVLVLSTWSKKRSWRHAWGELPRVSGLQKFATKRRAISSGNISSRTRFSWSLACDWWVVGAESITCRGCLPDMIGWYCFLCGLLHIFALFDCVSESLGSLAEVDLLCLGSSLQLGKNELSFGGRCCPWSPEALAPHHITATRPYMKACLGAANSLLPKGENDKRSNAAKGQHSTVFRGVSRQQTYLASIWPEVSWCYTEYYEYAQLKPQLQEIVLSGMFWMVLDGSCRIWNSAWQLDSGCYAVPQPVRLWSRSWSPSIHCGESSQKMLESCGQNGIQRPQNWWAIEEFQPTEAAPVFASKQLPLDFARTIPSLAKRASSDQEQNSSDRKWYTMP